MKIKTDYDLSIPFNEIIVMANDNTSMSLFGIGRFTEKWVNEIKNNPTNFVQFVTQVIDKYDKSVDIDKQIAITDDDINAMQTWGISEWISDGVLENYPKMAYTKTDGTVLPHYSTCTVIGKGDFINIKMTVVIDTDMLKYKLENERKYLNQKEQEEIER